MRRRGAAACTASRNRFASAGVKYDVLSEKIDASMGPATSSGSTRSPRSKVVLRSALLRGATCDAVAAFSAVSKSSPAERVSSSITPRAAPGASAATVRGSSASMRARKALSSP